MIAAFVFALFGLVVVTASALGSRRHDAPAA